jgi:hypothetical protein
MLSVAVVAGASAICRISVQAFVERVTLNDTRCGAAVGDRMRAATGNLVNGAQTVFAVHRYDLSSGELPSAISIRAKCTLTPSGMTFGYQFSTTVLTLGTMTPDLLCHFAPPRLAPLVNPRRWQYGRNIK